MDGCSRFSALVQIVLPLAAPSLAVAFLFAFVFAWNELLFALTLTLTANAKTLPVQIIGNVTLRGPRYWDIAAQSSVMMIPPLIVSPVANRYISRCAAILAAISVADS